MFSKDYMVYLLHHTIHNRTYLGITNHKDRRIRQHNGELKGGAKYTTSFKGEGEWKYYMYVSNLTKSEALSIERTAKNKRRGAKGTSAIEKRLHVLLPILEKYPECTTEYLYLNGPSIA
jgi:putative endonuclease